MSSLQQELRVLIATHGLEGVHTALNDYMRREYEFLTRLLNTPSTVQQQHVPVVEQLPTEVAPIKVKNVKITVKKSAEPVELPQELPQEVVQELPTENKFRSPTEIKEFQRLAVEKKHAELQAIDVSAASILTKENLKKWVEEGGNTYAWVAREKAGVPESEVAAIAKSHGIVSKISKRRGVIIAQKKRPS